MHCSNCFSSLWAFSCVLHCGMLNDCIDLINKFIKCSPWKTARAEINLWRDETKIKQQPRYFFTSNGNEIVSAPFSANPEVCPLDMVKKVKMPALPMVTEALPSFLPSTFFFSIAAVYVYKVILLPIFNICIPIVLVYVFMLG